MANLPPDQAEKMRQRLHGKCTVDRCVFDRPDRCPHYVEAVPLQSVWDDVRARVPSAGDPL